MTIQPRNEMWALKVHLELSHQRLFTRHTVATWRLADYEGLHELCHTEEGTETEEEYK
jgi:hypothetical protein